MTSNVPVSSAEEPRLDPSAARQEDGRLSRRGLLSLFAALPLVGIVPFARQVVGYGYLDVDETIRRGYFPARVTLDGVDVSNQCYACDDVGGIVWLHRLNGQGKAYYDFERDDVAREIRRGRVVFTPNTGTTGGRVTPGLNQQPNESDRAQGYEHRDNRAGLNGWLARRSSSNRRGTV